MKNPNQPFEWYDRARYGLFIHWGIYSLLGRGEQVLFRERLDHREYEKLARRFNPGKFDADDWARQAKAAGMKYAVLTTKHHDGFCLFDSAHTDYTSVKTAAGRDLVGEYVRAFRRHGLRVGLYYSLADWRFPAYFDGSAKDPKAFSAFRSTIHEQVRELCTNYGRIDVLWFDGGWPHDAATWQSGKLDRMIRRLQPHVMINDRLHGGGGGNVKPVGKASLRRHGYYDTAEQHAPGVQPVRRPIETLRTTHDSWWGYCKGDPHWKSPREAVRLLSHAAGCGANFLLNVGPKADGTFPVPFQRILMETGRWLAGNGEGVYDTVEGILDLRTLGWSTLKGKALYLHVHYWPGREAIVYGLANRVRSARILGTGQSVRVAQDGLHVRLQDLPARAPDPACSVIKLNLDGAPREDPSVVHLWEQGRALGSLSRWVSTTAGS
jgi:alpha-L-fucosidase